jgi:hypothetical protein
VVPLSLHSFPNTSQPPDRLDTFGQLVDPAVVLSLSLWTRLLGSCSKKRTLQPALTSPDSRDSFSATHAPNGRGPASVPSRSDVSESRENYVHPQGDLSKRDFFFFLDHSNLAATLHRTRPTPSSPASPLHTIWQPVLLAQRSLCMEAFHNFPRNASVRLTASKF